VLAGTSYLECAAGDEIIDDSLLSFRRPEHTSYPLDVFPGALAAAATMAISAAGTSMPSFSTRALTRMRSSPAAKRCNARSLSLGRCRR